jgi:hypothetical protein
MNTEKKCNILVESCLEVGYFVERESVCVKPNRIDIPIGGNVYEYLKRMKYQYF